MLKFEKTDVRRNFFPGDIWLSMKLYCSVKVSDPVLINLHSAAQSLIRKGIIKEWFFIRYADPYHHLRLRLHLSQTDLFGVTLQSVRSAIEHWEAEGYINKIEVDTYVRELERYTPGLMPEFETIFCRESELVAASLSMHSDNPDMWRWQCCLKCIDGVLEHFLPELEDRMEILRFLVAALQSDFDESKEFKKELNNRYRQYRYDIQDLFSGKNDNFGFIDTHLKNARSLYRRIVDQTIDRKPVLIDLCCSSLHMLCNRFFRNNQKCYELVLYELLFRYYTTSLKVKNQPPIEYEHQGDTSK